MNYFGSGGGGGGVCVSKGRVYGGGIFGNDLKNEHDTLVPADDHQGHEEKTRQMGKMSGGIRENICQNALVRILGLVALNDSGGKRCATGDQEGPGRRKKKNWFFKREIK